MAYSSYTIMVEMYGEELILSLSDRDHDGVADQDAIAKALTFADDTVNSYLAGRYETPVTTTSSLLAGYATDVAIYRLAPTADVLTEEITKRYERAIAWLKDVSAGKASIPELSESVEAVQTSLTVESSSSERLFSRQSMRGL